MRKRWDTQGHFLTIFNEQNGFYFRSDVIENGRATGKDPFMAEFPELLDVGIMGHCAHGKAGLCLAAGVQCYQSGPTVEEENMSMTDFEWIARQCEGRTFQFALGGRGDPDQHEYFEEVLQICREKHIVPNFTSSGYGFDSRIALLCKKHCGAVAISWYRNEYTLRAIKMLLEQGVRTNIHYVLSRATLKEAIALLEQGGFPDGVNAVIFLLHKPAGLGQGDQVLTCNEPDLQYFFQLIDQGHFRYKIGFDSCSVPGLLNGTESVDRMSLDTCEGARWSAYISPRMMMTPCSFDWQGKGWGVDLRRCSIEEAWNSENFERFRRQFRISCPQCDKRDSCMGGCPIYPSVVLCEDYRIQNSRCS